MSLILSGTNGLSDVDGSAATPAIRGTDANTGIFFPAADTVGMSTGGSERVRVDSSGNVGIGTTSNASGGKLEVNGGFISSALSGKYLNFGWSGSNAYIQTTDVSSTGYNLIFYGGASERMRIDTSGNLLVGTTSGFGARFSVLGASGSTGGIFRVSTNGDYGVAFQNASGTTVGNITVNSASTAYNTSSDYRLKENVQPMTGALATVALLKPCTYKWKVDGSDSQGFIAHELQTVMPDCVTGKKDAIDADGKPIYQGIDTSFLIPTLVKAIQEQQALILSLTDRITALEAP